MGRGGYGHPFSFESLNYFYIILRKIKRIYIAGKWASILATPFWIFWIHPCNSSSLTKKIEMKFGRRTLLISLSEVAGLFFLSQLLFDDIMLYRTFETNMNFYLDHNYILLCTGTVWYLQMPVFASSSLVLDYKKCKNTAIINMCTFTCLLITLWHLHDLIGFCYHKLLIAPLIYKSWFSLGKGGTQQNFIQGGSSLRSNNLLFYIPFLTEKVPLSYTFYWKMVPLSHI